MDEHLKALTAREVSEVLRFHVNAIKRIPASELPYFRIGRRGDRRYWFRDVMAYIERGMVR